jgi:Flp pilus assembly protein CpaB
VPVLVARALIPRGTPGESIATQNLYQVTTVRRDQLRATAITNPGLLTGEIASHDILPAAQLTTADFTSVDASDLRYQLKGAERAIAVPVDATHGLIGQLSVGATVDVYVAVSSAPGTATRGAGPIVQLLAPDILVLAAPGAAGGSAGGSSSVAVLRVTTEQAAQFAYAAENARLWFVLRPQVGASATPQRFVTLSSLLAGTR